ncbi:hypothetical protein LSH36_1000g00034 [Paralvinella palmiformis]|uniref:Uncharacterized protein n=1 Tax=Paralvinella palmiformis TaxID=53620 RepID=A0AAD9IWP8_9ANNE|nr:hypothetical protein LSH36_1000g00034 [Paralvinella palmiformis]
MDCNNILGHTSFQDQSSGSHGDTTMSGANLPDQDDTERIEMSEAEHPLLSLPATPGRTSIQNAGVHVNRILDCPKCGGRIRRSPRSFSLSVLPEEAPLRSDSDSSIAERHPEEEALPEPDTPPNSPEVTTGTDPQPLPCRCGKRRVSEDIITMPDVDHRDLKSGLSGSLLFLPAGCHNRRGYRSRHPGAKHETIPGLRLNSNDSTFRSQKDSIELTQDCNRFSDQIHNHNRDMRELWRC